MLALVVIVGLTGVAIVIVGSIQRWFRRAAGRDIPALDDARAAANCRPYVRIDVIRSGSRDGEL